MTKSQTIRLCYGIVIGIFTVLVGALFIFTAADIYYGGADPAGKNYTRELVGQKLTWLLIPVCLWIASIIAGFVLSVLFPVKDKLKNKREPRDTVKKLSKKLPDMRGNAEYDAFLKKQNIRLVVYATGALYSVASAIVCLVYLFQVKNFPAENLNAEVLRMLANVLPFVASVLAVWCGILIYDRISAKAELPCVKALFQEKTGEMKPPSFLETKVAAVQKGLSSKWVLLGVRVGLAVLGAVFFLVGIWNGGARDVLIKAVNICTECIGLG